MKYKVWGIKKFFFNCKCISYSRVAIVQCEHCMLVQESASLRMTWRKNKDFVENNPCHSHCFILYFIFLWHCVLVSFQRRILSCVSTSGFIFQSWHCLSAPAFFLAVMWSCKHQESHKCCRENVCDVCRELNEGIFLWALSFCYCKIISATWSKRKSVIL